MKPSSTFRYVLALAGSTLVAVSSAHAVDGYWDNYLPEGLWGDYDNWVASTPPDASDTAYFINGPMTGPISNGMEVNRTVSLSFPVTQANLVFGDNNTATAENWLLTYDTDPANNLILAGTTPGITVNQLGLGATTTISVIIGGTAGLVKSGAGPLVLSRVNTYTGTTTVSGGELRWGLNNALSTGNLTINNGGTANIQNFSDTVGTVTLAQGGTITGSTGILSTSSGSIVSNGGGTVSGFTSGGGVSFGYSVATSSLTYNDVGTSTTLSINRLIMGSVSGINRTFTIADGEADIDVDIQFLGNAADASAPSLYKNGPGVMQLSGTENNTNWGLDPKLYINEGTLLLNKTGGVIAIVAGGSALTTIGDNGGAPGSVVLRYATGSSSNQIDGHRITINSDGLFDLNGFSETLAGALTHSSGGSIKTGGGTLTLTGFNAATINSTSTVTGNLTFTSTSATALTIGGTANINGTTTFSSTGGIIATGTPLIEGNLALGTGTHTIAVTNSSDNLTISAQITGSTGQITKNGAGTLTLSNATSTFNNQLNVSAGTLAFANGALGPSGMIQVNGGTLRWLPGNTQDISSRLRMANATTSIFDTGGNNVTFASAIGNLTNNNASTGNIAKIGLGSLTLQGTNTNTGATSLAGGGALVLDYGTTNTNKIAGVLTLAGGTLTLKGATGSHLELVTSTSLSAGGTFLTRDGVNTAKLEMNVITRAAGGTISFGSDTLATTDTNNVNGILGGWATLGNDWAKSVDASAANTAITAFTTYTTYVNTGGVSTTNYLLNGDGTVAAGGNAVGTLKITNSANSQTLNLDNNNLTITSTSATALGGIMYAGGNDNLYTIGNGGGTGRIVTSTADQELIFAVQTGTLSVSAFVGASSGSSSVTKSGVGTMEISSSNAYTGAVRVNQGVLRLANANATGTNAGGIIVQNGAALELTGGFTFIDDGLTLTGTGVSSGGALRNVSGANTYPGPITIGNGGARIHNADGGNALNIRGITTAVGADVTFDGASITHSAIAISGNGGVIKVGAGTFTTSVANTYTGTTTISNGTFALSGSGGLADTGAVNIDNAAGIFNISAITATSETIGSLTGVASSSVVIGAKNLTVGDATNTTFAGVISGPSGGSLTKRGAGTLTLTSTNTYTGGTIVSFGTLAFANGALGSSGTINASGGTLRWLSGNTEDISSRLAMTASTTSTFDTNGNNVTFASAIGNSTASLFSKTGLGILTLGSATTYTGGTIITGGELRWGVNDALSTGYLTIENGSIANIQGFTDTVGTITLNQGGTISGTTGVLATGVGGFVSSGGGTVSGFTTGALALGSTTSNIGLTYNDAGTSTTLSINRLYLNSTNGGGTRTFNINDGDAAIDLDITSYLGAAAAGSNLNIIKIGSGVMQLSGSVDNTNWGTNPSINIHDGTLLLNKTSGVAALVGNATSIITIGDGIGAASSAILRLNVSDQIPSNGITINSDGLFDLNGKNETILGAFTHSSGGSINFGGATLTLANATNTISSANTISGNFTFSGAAVTNLTLGGTTIINGTTSFSSTGGITSTGTPTIQGTLALDSGTHTITVTSGTLTISAQITGSEGPITKSGDGTLTLSHANNTYSGSIVASAGTLSLTGALNGGGAISTSGIGIGGIVNQSAAGVISGASTFTQGSSGTSILNGTNTYTGTTAVEAGVLVAGTNSLVSTDGAFGNASSEINLGFAGGNNSASILIGGAYTVGRNIRLMTTNINTVLGELTLGGNTAHNSVFSGDIFLGATDSRGCRVTLTAASGGQVTFSGVIQNPTNMVSSPLPVKKLGLGTAILSNANPYTGGTNIDLGTLLVNNTSGSGTGTGAVAVTGATLGGNGTISGNVTVAKTGKLAPGNSAVGTLTLGGNLTFTVTSSDVGTLNYELDTIAASDKIDLTAGTLSIGTAALDLNDFNFTALNVLPYGTYTLISTANAITDTLGTPLTGTLGAATITLQISGDGTDIELVVSDPAGAPEIAVEQNLVDIPNSSGSKSFGTVTIGSTPVELVFTIRNTGNAALNLSGTPDYVAVSGHPDFTVTVQPDINQVPATSGSTTFTVRFTPQASGARSATISIANNDPDDGEAPFTFAVTGTGQTLYDVWAGGGGAFDADANGDGVKNGLAFLLGASGPNSAVTVPTVTQSDGNLVLSFNCLPVADRGGASLKVAHTTTLSSWTATANAVPDATNSSPDNNVTFVVADGPAGPPALKSVTTTIAAAAAAAGKLFGRLEATP